SGAASGEAAAGGRGPGMEAAEAGGFPEYGAVRGGEDLSGGTGIRRPKQRRHFERQERGGRERGNCRDKDRISKGFHEKNSGKPGGDLAVRGLPDGGVPDLGISSSADRSDTPQD